MQQPIAIMNLKTCFVAAAVTVASVAVMSGVTSATPTTQSNAKVSANASVQQNNQESQAATDLRTGLDALLREHVTTNIAVNRSIASGASQAEIDAGIAAQVENSDALSAAVGSIYGAEAEAQFSEMFLEHIEESNAYAMAVAAGDESAKVAANEELVEYLEEIATFFSGATGLPYDAVYGLLLEHEMLINNSTEALTERNFGQSKKFERQALKQVSVIADALSSAIIVTNPDKF